jgi:hypothetical protein
VQADDRNLAKALGAIRIHDLAGEIHAQFAGRKAFRLRLRSEKGERFAEIAYDPQQKDAELRVNGTTAGFESEGLVSLRAFLDGSVLEVVANERAAITARVYSNPSTPLQLEMTEIEQLEAMDVWGMKAISKDRLTSG